MSELKLCVWFIVLLLNGIMVGCVSVMICIDGVSNSSDKRNTYNNLLIIGELTFF